LSFDHKERNFIRLNYSYSSVEKKSLEPAVPIRRKVIHKQLDAFRESTDGGNILEPTL